MLLAAQTTESTMHIASWHWPLLFAIISALLLIDILVIHRKAHVIHTREAVIESIVWIAIGLTFGVFMFVEFGSTIGGQYMASYVVEKSLSIDNVFVWSIILTHFRIPAQFQHRVLFWGIFGALAMRLAFIAAGAAILHRFEFALVLFGLFLVYTGFKIFSSEEDHFDPAESRAMKIVHRFVPSTDEIHGQKLFVRVHGVRLATPLFAVLVLIELTDVIFAVDSVPAVLAISPHQFIAFSSNAFAILGLRALYFLLADMRDRFAYMQTGLGFILVFVGIKMTLGYWWHMPTAVSLAVIFIVLAVSVVASIVATPKPS